MAGTAFLTVNAGSSSLKIGLFAVDGDVPAEILRGEVQGIGDHPAHFSARDAAGRDAGHLDWPAGATHEDILGKILLWARDHLGGRTLGAAGHRIVHGGRALTQPVLIEDAVMRAMQALVPLAPLHQPHCLSAVRAVAAACPGLAQVACFDTAFHRTMPEVARRFAIPRALHDEGVERYGFHGLSYDYVAGRLAVLDADVARRRVVVAHLGSGASLCAMLGGHSVDTTMGMTALDGLVMGTRCGAIDPGVLLYLLQAKGMSAGEVEDLLYHRSGLLGVSGETADMHVLEQDASASAREAIELFAYQVARQACQMASALSGLDALVFTAGIGAHAPRVRQAVCERLAWLGVEIYPAAPAKGESCISTRRSRVAVWVIPTDEEAVIAREMVRLIKRPGRP